MVLLVMPIYKAIYSSGNHPHAKWLGLFFFFPLSVLYINKGNNFRRPIYLFIFKLFVMSITNWISLPLRLSEGKHDWCRHPVSSTTYHMLDPEIWGHEECCAISWENFQNTHCTRGWWLYYNRNNNSVLGLGRC